MMETDILEIPQVVVASASRMNTLRPAEEAMLTEDSLRDLLRDGYETSDADFVASPNIYMSRTVYFMAHFLAEKNTSIDSRDLQLQIIKHVRANGVTPKKKFNPVDWFSSGWRRAEKGHAPEHFKDEYRELFDRDDRKLASYRIKAALYESVVRVLSEFSLSEPSRATARPSLPNPKAPDTSYRSTDNGMFRGVNGAIEIAPNISGVAKQLDEYLTITRPAALVRQGSLNLYATSLKVRDLGLPNFYRINKLDPEDGAGYQRILNQGRANRLAEYLLDGQKEGDAFLPTSIFLATSRDIPFDSSSNTITFDVARVGPFNVVDGQHRIAGLVAAAEKNPELKDFEIPVNIAVGLDDVSQMCHFLIVNTTQRSVDKAVEQQIVARLSDMIDLEKMPTIPRWIRRHVEKGEDARALVVVNFLNTDANSPWLGKIRMANEEDDTGVTVTQKSFVNSLKKYVFSSNNPLSDPSWDVKRPMILSNYWKAVTELLVDEEASKPTVIFKTTGVDLFHIISATVFTHLVNQKDFTKNTMKTLLTRGFGHLDGDAAAIPHPEWWQSGGVAGGLNNSAVRKIATVLNHAINVQDDVDSISL